MPAPSGTVPFYGQGAVAGLCDHVAPRRAVPAPFFSRDGDLSNSAELPSRADRAVPMANLMPGCLGQVRGHPPVPQPVLLADAALYNHHKPPTFLQPMRMC
jgi:hypothetical protein